MIRLSPFGSFGQFDQPGNIFQIQVPDLPVAAKISAGDAQVFQPGLQPFERRLVTGVLLLSLCPLVLSFFTLFSFPGRDLKVVAVQIGHIGDQYVMTEALVVVHQIRLGQVHIYVDCAEVCDFSQFADTSEFALVVLVVSCEI